jgi:transcription-repair coupling factor (superfamily II helicase)
MNRIAPTHYLQGTGLNLTVGERLDLNGFRKSLTSNAYRLVEQVTEHGEFAIRGSIIDLFPMGCELPFRIELFDDEVETIRSFDTDSQRSIEKLERIALLPATEFPLTPDAIEEFRRNWRGEFSGMPKGCPVYDDVGRGIAAPGIEYFIPFFFEETACLTDYLPNNATIFRLQESIKAAEKYWQDIGERYEQLSHDIVRPILKPQLAFFTVSDLFAKVNQFQQIEIQQNKLDDKPQHINFASSPLPDVNANHKLQNPLSKLQEYLSGTDNRVLFTAETAGRQEALLELFSHAEIKPTAVENWQDFLSSKANLCITTQPLDTGFVSDQEQLSLIAEAQIYGEKVLQRRRRKQSTQDTDALIRNLAELRVGDPVVHLDNGVGRFQGMKTITTDGRSNEYLELHYASNAKLFVPVANLHLISRYTGTDPEHAPLHYLGSDSWEKAKKKAAAKVRDVAAELLDIYAKRSAATGFQFNADTDYENFANNFPFEETPDQLNAIENVIKDMQGDKSMDRLVCGDVGFGKTEVAMRAAFIAASNSKQVAILSPTTLLTQQHYQNFKDRFANWPIRIETLSRFKTPKEQKQIIEGLEAGTVDIVVGTHKLLNKAIKYKDLGLLVIDEEQRFGVRQKEQIKALRANVDILTLTATPIPRTLNMAFSGIRDLSIIATPPARRLAVKTFINKRSNSTIKEAVLREILRGGQVYFLHNKVETIEKVAREISELVPEANVVIGHGQMSERQLEQVMSDFYHRKFNVLVSTTIIESGIDIPNANTIIIDRADKFGLSQLHQLRGRVGRSHHQAYAYLLIPDPKLMTKDAEKRLDAIASLKDLGIGFSLATHDLEIRGAGEILGDEQSGQMQEVGFSFYMSMLNRAVKALKRGEQINLEEPLDNGPEVDLRISAIIPEDYLADVHGRLTFYKRISNAKNEDELRELQVEMVDRLGLMPEPVKNLFAVTSIKLKAAKLGIKKLEANAKYGKIHFNEKPNVDPAVIIKLIQTRPNFFKLLGQDKLRFELLAGETAEARIRQIEKVLEHFTCTY